MTTVKEKLEARYPNQDWSHLTNGADGDYPVFYFDGSYKTYDDMWITGLPKLTSQEIVTLLQS